MGWWSETIMGGDEPLDWVAELAEACGIKDTNFDDDSNFHGFVFTANKIEKNLGKLLKTVEASRYFSGPLIGYQVLAILIMHHGATFPAKTRKLILAKVDEYLASDEWKEWCGSSKRYGYVKNLTNTIKDYKNGTPTQIKEEGLFENMAKAMGII